MSYHLRVLPFQKRSFEFELQLAGWKTEAFVPPEIVIAGYWPVAAAAAQQQTVGPADVPKLEMTFQHAACRIVAWQQFVMREAFSSAAGLGRIAKQEVVFVALVVLTMARLSFRHHDWSYAEKMCWEESEWM